MINTLGHLDVDAALLLCVFYSVSNNVYENLAQVERIADQVFLVYFSDFYLEGLVFLCCLRADDNREIMHQICQRKRFLAQRHAPAGNPRHVEHIIDQTHQMGRCSLNLLKTVEHARFFVNV